jgi:P27 family predicted phage terminase small subunit
LSKPQLIFSMARPRKPSRLKSILGTARKDRENHDEPRPRADVPRCPTWLDKGAKRKWKELAPELSRLGLLTIIDGDVLAAYCQAWAEFEHATKTLQAEGRTVTRGTGGKCDHPAVAQQRTVWKAIKEFAEFFGLDPSSRGRLEVPAPDAVDPFEELLNSGSGHN